MVEAYRVSNLTGLLKETLESDQRLANIWVEGEISNFSQSTAGHAYFTLKDEAAQIRCVMFRRAYSGASVQDGAQMLIHGNISLYETRGDLQLVVDFVELAGIGIEQAQFEQLKERLESEGMFALDRKRSLPRFPYKIGVVTSPTGAVFHDICHVLERRWPLSEILLAPAVVQGLAAPLRIVAAIEQLNDEAVPDVIIIARGGGSAEELSAFNDEAVARAIHGSQVPVVSGIGHETDYTIADLVADLRAPTPSAAAELVAPDRALVNRELAVIADSISSLVPAQIAHHRLEVQAIASRMNLSLPDLGQRRKGLGVMLQVISSTLGQKMEQRKERLKGHALRLRALDPKGTLARGYAVIQHRHSKEVVTSAGQVEGGTQLRIYVKDGHFPAEVSK